MGFAGHFGWDFAVKLNGISRSFSVGLSNLGTAYTQIRRWQDAKNAFQQAVRIKPDYAVAHYFLGVTNYAMDDSSAALDEYKILKKLDVELADRLFDMIYE